MTVADEIKQIIAKPEFVTCTVTEASNLYTDLGYDSFSFVCLLIDIEKAYSIKFGLTEMNKCLIAGNLIKLVEQKTVK